MTCPDLVHCLRLFILAGEEEATEITVRCTSRQGNSLANKYVLFLSSVNVTLWRVAEEATLPFRLQ